jgi:hypothetical protein
MGAANATAALAAFSHPLCHSAAMGASAALAVFGNLGCCHHKADQKQSQDVQKRYHRVRKIQEIDEELITSPRRVNLFIVIVVVVVRIIHVYQVSYNQL